ncbi:MAG: glycine betaine/L-proline ABC transporter ATP-binding protein [Cyanobacteriota bacterium]|nr:glycine betaine/L-proline ABC transporter ATP-binding protein [Cyanobacteriota bacterium]
MEKPKIIIQNLIKIYGKKPRVALKMFREGANRDTILKTTSNILGVADVSLNIYPGELFVVMGLSGSGKSTLVRCINRLLAPTSGHVYIDDEDVAHVSEERMREIRRTKVAMVFQRFGLFPHKTVVENVAYGLKIRGLSKGERREKAINTLETVGLKDWADYLPSSLSGGMQQRVGLARALATDADILLMDEAFSALDPLIRREMQDELLRLQQELHKTIVFISHDIQEALKLGDRVAVMKDGYIVQVGRPEELITEPADDYIRDFVADVNPAKVLKTGTVARERVCLILGKDSPRGAMEMMLKQNLRQTIVLDRWGKPTGIVNQQTLRAAVEAGNSDIAEIMETDFPRVGDSATLEEIFHLYREDMPVAVVNDRGKFMGAIESSDILSCMGRADNRQDAGG